MVPDEKEQKKTEIKKEIMSFRCKMVGNYSNECEEELYVPTYYQGRQL